MLDIFCVYKYIFQYTSIMMYEETLHLNFICWCAQDYCKLNLKLFISPSIMREAFWHTKHLSPFLLIQFHQNQGKSEKLKYKQK